MTLTIKGSDGNVVQQTSNHIHFSRIYCFIKRFKKQGWKFVGPTTIYAFMQAMGLINDHVEGCIVRARVAKARKIFHKPPHG